MQQDVLKRYLRNLATWTQVRPCFAMIQSGRRNCPYSLTVTLFVVNLAVGIPLYGRQQNYNASADCSEWIKKITGYWVVLGLIRYWNRRWNHFTEEFLNYSAALHAHSECRILLMYSWSHTDGRCLTSGSVYSLITTAFCEAVLLSVRITAKLITCYYGQHGVITGKVMQIQFCNHSSLAWLYKSTMGTSKFFSFCWSAKRFWSWFIKRFYIIIKNPSSSRQKSYSC